MAQKFPFHVTAVKIETGRWLNGQADFLETSGVGQELNYSRQLVASTKYIYRVQSSSGVFRTSDPPPPPKGGGYTLAGR
jgi:hypothetical protein